MLSRAARTSLRAVVKRYLNDGGPTICTDIPTLRELLAHGLLEPLSGPGDYEFSSVWLNHFWPTALGVVMATGESCNEGPGHA